VGVSIYELLASPAQAFTFSDSRSDFFALDAANASSEFAALNQAFGVDASLNGFDKLAWLNSETHNESFAFAGARGETVDRGGGLLITDAAAKEDSARSSGNLHVGAGAVDAPIGHGGFEQAGSPRNAELGTTQATEVDGPNHGQSRLDFQVSEEGSANGKPHAEQESPGQDPAQTQSQRDLHVSEEGAAKGKPHAEHEPPGQDLTPRQSQRDLHVSEEGAAKGTPHAEHEPPGQDLTQRQSQDDMHVAEGNSEGKTYAGHGPPAESNRGQLHRDVDASKDAPPAGHTNSDKSQPDLHTAHSNASENRHAEPGANARGNDQGAADSEPTQTAAAPELGDSFHFRNDMAEAKHSDHLEDNQRPQSDENGLHNAGDNGLALIQHADLIGPSHAEQGVVDHARSVEHHPTHDLFI
ncbi:hypothetical protein, partial [Bradyrhizobium sacchari]